MLDRWRYVLMWWKERQSHVMEAMQLVKPSIKYSLVSFSQALSQQFELVIPLCDAVKLSSRRTRRNFKHFSASASATACSRMQIMLSSYDFRFAFRFSNNSLLIKVSYVRLLSLYPSPSLDIAPSTSSPRLLFTQSVRRRFYLSNS